MFHAAYQTSSNIHWNIKCRFTHWKRFFFFLVFGSYIKDWPQRYLCKFCGWCNMYMTHTTNSCFSCSAGQNPSSCGEGSSADLPEIQAVPGTLRRTHGELRPLMKCSLIPVCRWEFYFLPVIPWYGYILFVKGKSSYLHNNLQFFPWCNDSVLYWQLNSNCIYIIMV